MCRVGDSESQLKCEILVPSGERLVNDYRVYCLGGDGKISRAHWYQAVSLESVIELARENHEASIAKYGKALSAWRR